MAGALRGQLEALATQVANAVPKGLGGGSLPALSSLQSSLPQAFEGLPKPPAGFPDASSLPKIDPASFPQAPGVEYASRLIDAAQSNASGVGTINASVTSHLANVVDTANEVFTAVGLKVWVVHAGTPNVQARVRISGEGLIKDGKIGAMTPRQFIQLMRESQVATRGRGIADFVKNMIASGRVTPVPLLPNSLQEKLYTDIARIMVFSFERALAMLHDTSVWGHVLQVNTSLKPLKVSQRNLGARSAVGKEQIGVIVDSMLSRKSGFGMVPLRIERQVLVNSLLVVFQLVEELLTGENEEIFFMGHRLGFELQPIAVDILRNIAEGKPVHHCHIDEAVLHELVDELLLDPDTNIGWIPDVIEMQMYTNVLRFVIRVAEESLGRLRLDMLGREVRVKILSEEDRKVEARTAEGAASQAMFYYEEESPLKTVSTTELQERVKALEEQRRMLQAIQELGRADFDLMADSPFLQANAKTVPSGAPEVSAATQEARPGEAQAESVTSMKDEEDSFNAVHEFHHMSHQIRLGRSLCLKCEVETDVEVPLCMIAELETYPLWMPWCTDGGLREKVDSSDGIKSHVDLAGPSGEYNNGYATFGFDTGTFLGTVGDEVKYRVGVKRAAPASRGREGRVIADAVNGFAYGRRLVYDWRFRQITPTRTAVQLDMYFEANGVLYMPIWDSMKDMVMNNMLHAFMKRAELLQVDRNAARAAGELEPVTDEVAKVDVTKLEAANVEAVQADSMQAQAETARAEAAAAKATQDEENARVEAATAKAAKEDDKARAEVANVKAAKEKEVAKAEASKAKAAKEEEVAKAKAARVAANRLEKAKAEAVRAQINNGKSE